MNKKIYLGIYIAISTGLMIGLFLSGKIIYIPHGTHKGGLIGAIGVLIIIIFMSILGILAHRLISQKKTIIHLKHKLVQND
jgi:hypothetical protein